MARKKGTLNISSNIEPNAAAPLDARTLVATLEDLTVADTFPFPYAGMTVTVRAEKESYMFTGGDITDPENWKRVGISEELEAEITANTAAIETLNGAGEGSVKKAVADGVAEIVASAPEDFDTLKEIADYIDADKTGAAQMSTAISDNTRAISQAQADIVSNAEDISQAKQDISNLESAVQDAEYDDTAITERIANVESQLGGHTVGVSVPADALFTDTVYDDSAVQSSIRTMQTAISNLSQGESATTQDLTALEGRVSENESAIETLNGTGAGSVKKAVADGIAEVVAEAPEDLDTLKEIADYIASDKTGAAQMSNAIAANAQDIAANTNAIAEAKDDIERNASDIAAAQSSIRTVQTALGNHTVQKDVPADAVFTDTVYDDAALTNRMQAAEQDIETLKVSGYDDTVIRARVQTTEENIENLKGADTALSGRVTNVEGALGGHSLGKDVPADAKFTDTVYDDSELQTAVSGIRTDLANYYLKTETFSKSEIQDMITTINALKIIAVTALPAADIDESAIYIVKDSEEVGNLYSEYIRVDGKWEQFGTARINMDGYVTTQALNTALASYVTASEMNTALANKADKTEIPDVSGKANKSDLAAVATSGSYNDLSDTPDAYELPTASDTTLGGIKVDSTSGATVENGVLKVAQQTVAGGGAIPAYIVGDAQFAYDWLSAENNGSALTPVDGQEYVILTDGEWLRKHVIWLDDIGVYRLTGKVNVSSDLQRKIKRPESFTQKLNGTIPQKEHTRSSRNTTNAITLAVQEGDKVSVYFRYGLKSGVGLRQIHVGAPNNWTETVSTNQITHNYDNGIADFTEKSTWNKTYDVTQDMIDNGFVVQLDSSSGSDGGTQSAIKLYEGTYTIFRNAPYYDYETDDILDITEEEIEQIWNETAGEPAPENNVFSTEERLWGYWIDGKPIYRKTINYGSMPNNTYIERAHGIANIDKIVKIDGTAIDSSSGWSLPVGDANPVGSSVKITVKVNADRTNLWVQTMDDRRAYNLYVTLYYTKTTD